MDKTCHIRKRCQKKMEEYSCNMLKKKRKDKRGQEFRTPSLFPRDFGAFTSLVLGKLLKGVGEFFKPSNVDGR